MKAFLTFILFLFCLSAMAIIEPTGYSNYIDAKGNIVHEDKSFIMVRNNDSSSIASGTPVRYIITDDDGMSVTASDDSPGRRVACVTAESISASSMGLCQVRGKHTAVVFGIYNDGTTINATAGDELYLCNGTAAACALVVGTVGMPQSFATALDNGTASGTIEAYIHVD